METGYEARESMEGKLGIHSHTPADGCFVEVLPVAHLPRVVRPWAEGEPALLREPVRLEGRSKTRSSA